MRNHSVPIIGEGVSGLGTPDNAGNMSKFDGNDAIKCTTLLDLNTHWFSNRLEMNITLTQQILSKIDDKNISECLPLALEILAECVGYHRLLTLAAKEKRLLGARHDPR